MPFPSCFELCTHAELNREREEVRKLQMHVKEMAELREKLMTELIRNMGRHHEILEEMNQSITKLQAENKRLAKRLDQLERKQ